MHVGKVLPNELHISLWIHALEKEAQQQQITSRTKIIYSYTDIKNTVNGRVYIFIPLYLVSVELSADPKEFLARVVTMRKVKGRSVW